ncbi:MAG: rhomboid family intramembrane serine protease [Acidimicrobiales bacterium]
MIPLKDYNPTRRFPFVTVVLILVNLGVYFFVQRPLASDSGAEAEFTYRYAAVPCEIIERRPLTLVEIERETCITDEADVPRNFTIFPEKSPLIAILSSMFLHGSVLHVAFNMLFLWVFGNNIEDRMGPVGYLIFYLAAGVVATMAHIAVDPTSTVPLVGASGAIAGVMGAYLVLFPNVPILSLVFVMVIDVPAKFLLGFWFILQFFTSPGSGVAWVAHVGGFVFGVLVAFLLRNRLRPPRVALPPPLY